MSRIRTPEALPYADLRLNHRDAEDLLKAIDGFMATQSIREYSHNLCLIRAEVALIAQFTDNGGRGNAIQLMFEQRKTASSEPAPASPVPAAKRAPARKKLTNEQRVAVIARLAAGEGPTAIAKSYGVTVGSIREYRHKDITKFQARTGVGA
ncbi:hypothetical protein WI87_23760 [Burkholderia ubonensis]|uniref:hypothetical protein n=1 Tax=Burkholderia ubonensis TaxID=101571 RepID=UPI00075B0A56|nr:hypothetical protein [Burkholderia ubonensis]KVD54720.1 hypothetical protein WI87_23760 [Burkholderia ubonensis]